MPSETGFFVKCSIKEGEERKTGKLNKVMDEFKKTMESTPLVNDMDGEPYDRPFFYVNECDWTKYKGSVPLKEGLRPLRWEHRDKLICQLSFLYYPTHIVNAVNWLDEKVHNLHNQPNSMFDECDIYLGLEINNINKFETMNMVLALAERNKEIAERIEREAVEQKTRYERGVEQIRKEYEERKRGIK